MTGGLVPFAFSGQEPKELAYSLEPSLSYNRKRDFHHSESSTDTVNKRLHEFTDGQEPDSEMWRIASSPPSVDNQYFSSESEVVADNLMPLSAAIPAGRTSSVSTITGGMAVKTDSIQTNTSNACNTSNTTPSRSFQVLSSYQDFSAPNTQTQTQPLSQTQTQADEYHELDRFLGTNRTKSYQKALEIIQNCVDNALPVLNLESLQLRRIPEDIGDLKNMVLTSLDKPLVPDIHVFLQNNLIFKVPPQLFEVTNISVLSLRNNQIRYIPPSLAKLKNLRNLSLGGNELRYLPSELLELDQLEVLSIHPNPLISSDDGYSDDASDDSRNDSRDNEPPPQKQTQPDIDMTANEPTRYAVQSRLKLPKSGYVSNCPSLSESCLKMLSQLVITQGDRNRWELDVRFSEILDKAIETRNNGVTCGTCKRSMVNGIGYVYEWWSGIVENKQVPLRRNLCSYACANKQNYGFNV